MLTQSNTNPKKPTKRGPGPVAFRPTSTTANRIFEMTEQERFPWSRNKIINWCIEQALPLWEKEFKRKEKV